jgi:hypothetical protein
VVTLEFEARNNNKCKQKQKNKKKGGEGQERNQLSWYSDQDTGWTSEESGFDSQQGHGIHLFSRATRSGLSPAQPLFDHCGDTSPEIKRRGHLVSKNDWSCAFPPPRGVQEKLPFALIIIIIIIIIMIINVAIPKSHTLHSTSTEKLQKYADLKDELVRTWQLQTACTVPPVLHTAGVIPNKLHDSSELLTLRPALFILMQ